jgi:hypothetical protein
VRFLDFIQLGDKYNSFNQHKACFNGSLGKIYNLRRDEVNNLNCNHWDCPRCRSKKKYQLFLETFYLVNQLDLNKHFIMTFQGKDFRDKYSYEESYEIMSKTWHKYQQVIEYHKGKFDYIKFPRAQQDGYCHFHIILPKFISWYFLDLKRKLYPELGFVRISKNVDLAEYLHRDFFKDHEYYIPKGVRHYSCSRGLTYNKFSNPYFQEDNAIILGRHTLSEFEDLVNKKFGRSLPNEEYLKEFVREKQYQIQKKGRLVNGVLEKPVITTIKGARYKGWDNQNRMWY